MILRGLSSSDALVGMLGLVDLSLTANLILIMICSSYENFIRTTDSTTPVALPRGLAQIGFSLLKQKLLGSIVAISAAHVLERYMDVGHPPDAAALALLVGAMLAFALAMLIVAAADRASDGAPRADH